MPREKQYRDAYADHCIRHPNNHVSYITFRQRCKKWGEKLAVRLGKRESALKMEAIMQERRNGFLHQKAACKKKAKKALIARILLGILLLGLGILIGTML